MKENLVNKLFKDKARFTKDVSLITRFNIASLYYINNRIFDKNGCLKRDNNRDILYCLALRLIYNASDDFLSFLLDDKNFNRMKLKKGGYKNEK